MEKGYKTLVQWASGGGARDCPVEVFQGIVRSWDWPPDQQKTYVQAILDCTHYTKFPMDALVLLSSKETSNSTPARSSTSPKKHSIKSSEHTSKKRRHIADESSDEEETAKESTNKAKTKMDSKSDTDTDDKEYQEGSYYEIETLLDNKDDETETSYFRVNHVRSPCSVDITWLYTHEQMKRDCEAAGYIEEVPVKPQNAAMPMYISTHIQPKLHIETPLRCIDAEMNKTLYIAGKHKVLFIYPYYTTCSLSIFTIALWAFWAI